ncbi:MAG TPA: iron uptake porin [Halomicronema sp.]
MMMLKIFKAALQYSPAVLGSALVLANSAFAAEGTAGTSATEIIPDSELRTSATMIAQMPVGETEEIAMPGQPSVNSLDFEGSAVESDPMGQLSNVNTLSDVQPTDWAYEALRNLVEKYGCIAGYPDQTFRGNRALTRYEFAAGVNACLEAITGQITPTGGVTREDLAVLERLLSEFQAELATLRGRVDSLEARTRELEENQFSTTTKLRGEAIFAGSDIIGDGGTNVLPHLHYRARLNLNTSFTGKDLLFTRLQAGNAPGLNYAPNSNMNRLSFEASTNNDLRLSKLYYRFPVGKATVFIDANDGAYNDNTFTFNPLFASDSQGSISRFGRFSPIYRQGGGQGITINYDFSKAFGITAGYLAPNGNNPDPDPVSGGGFFRGSYAALGQVTVRPSDAIALGFTYVHSYNRDGRNVSGGTGSGFANSPFNAAPTSADHFGVQASLKASSRFTLSGWAGYTKAINENTDNEATLWNWAVTLGLADLGKKGNLLGLVVGMPPKVTENDVSTREDTDTSLHFEAFYRYQVTDNISITPGVFVITNPDHNDNNDTDVVGTLRTTFTF